jgi:hypothetical protein
MLELILNAKHTAVHGPTTNSIGKPASLDFPSNAETEHLNLTVCKNVIMNSFFPCVIRRLAMAIFPIVLILTVLSAGQLALAAPQTQIILSCSIPVPFSHVPSDHCSSSIPSGVIVGSTDYVIGGFWIWCQVGGSGNSYGPDCSGSMYIEEVNLNTGVGVYDVTSISGNTLNYPQITFNTSDNDMTCTLTITGSSTLSGTCDGTSITFHNVIVQVT